MLKGGVVLDALSKCKGVAFDKTGTLTSGQLTCTSFSALYATLSIDFALSLAASVEQHVVHPIATAFLDYAKEKNILIRKVTNFSSLPGFGVSAVVEEKDERYKIFIGHYGFVKEQFSPYLQKQLKHFDPVTSEGKVTSYVLINDHLFSATFSDEIKSCAKNVIQSLSQDLGLDVTMLTGDHKENAHAVANVVGITNVHADLRPQDKLSIVSELSQEEGLVMLGDGINDAPALMRATVGISMGKIGSATAIDASDVVLLQDDLTSLPWLIKKSHSTTQVIKQNLFLALSVILLATTPALLGFIPLWVAVILHEGGTIIVGLNSLRLLKK
jgi:P-type E1-E2 ATPase